LGEGEGVGGNERLKVEGMKKRVKREGWRGRERERVP